MTSRTLTTVALMLSLAGCGAQATTSTSTASASGGETVDPVGIELDHEVHGMESYSRLAEALSGEDHRVDHGDQGVHEPSGRQMRNLVAGTEVMHIVELHSDSAAAEFVDRFSRDGRLFDGEVDPEMATNPPHIYTFGGAVVLYQGDDPALLASLDRVATGHAFHAGDDHELSDDELEAVVRARIEDGLAVPSNQLELVRREHVHFANACLGVPDAAEFCAEVATPGWRYTFRNGDEEIVAHADRNAARVFFPRNGTNGSEASVTVISSTQ